MENDDDIVSMFDSYRNFKKLLSGLWLTERGLFKFFFSFETCITPWVIVLILTFGNKNTVWGSRSDNT